MIIIYGVAGTGKSTYLAELIRKEKRSFIVLAATHAAVDNIYRIVGSIDRKYFTTLYSYFRIDYINNIVKGAIKHVDAIYIDEFSLLNKHLFTTCLKKTPKSEFILCGDPLQLNAIYDDNESITFNELRKLKGLSPLAVEHYHLGVFGIPEVKKAKKTVLKTIYRNEDVVRNIMNKIFIDNDDSYDKYPFIPFNDVIYKLNHPNYNYVVLASKYSILQEVYNELNLISKDKYTVTIKQKGLNGFSKLYLYENQELIITENTKQYYNGQRVYFADYNQHEDSIYVKTDKGEILKVVKIMYDFPLIPSNLLTIHKSQGVTLDYVILCINDLFDASMLYTALTRARKEIYFYTRNEQTYEEKVKILFDNAYVDVHNELKNVYYKE